MLQQSDHGKYQPDDRHVATRYERFPKCRDDREWAKSARDSGGETGDGDDEERVHPEDEPDNYDHDADQGKQLGRSTHCGDPPGRRRRCEQLARAGERVIQVHADIFLTDFLENGRPRQRDEGLHLQIG